MPADFRETVVELASRAAAMPAAARRSFLDEACGANVDLRQRVEDLLAVHEAVSRTTAGRGTVDDETVAEPAPSPATRSEPVPPIPSASPLGPEQSGAIVGRYKLLQVLGEGGCGTVFLAEQAEPVQRRVALKVIKLGMDTPKVVARFEAERQALAMMDHPHIAKVLDAGATHTGRPYFVMELVPGVSITRFCDNHRLDTRGRIALFVQVCRAIQHAHQKGIIHRDLKPSNILVSLKDNAPEPKIIDFGIAKATQGRLTDKTLFTAYEQFIGTPAYMSPEQAETTGEDVDTRSDIYSLGVLLYEVLTGRTPFDPQDPGQVGIDAIRRTIREVDPPRPSTRLSSLEGDALTLAAKARQTEGMRLVKLIRGDLDWIVMKCLEKSRTRRYDSANSLAEDLERFLDHRPVTARPPSLSYQMGKAMRRHRVLFSAAGMVLLAMTLAIVASTRQAVRARRAEQVARSEAVRSAHVTGFLREMLEGVDPGVAMGRDDPVLRSILDRASKRVFETFATEPEVAMDLARTIGRTYGALGKYEQAEAFQREVLEGLENAGRADALDAARALYELALTRERQGAWSEATNLLARSLGIARQPGGDVVAGLALGELAFVQLKTGRTLEAEQSCTEARQLLRTALGTSAPESLAAESRLAEIQFVRGHNREAIETAQRVLAAQRRRIGIDNPDSLRTLFILTAALQMEGRYTEAEPLARECSERRAAVLGPEHPATLAARDVLAMICSFQGRYAEAERLCRSTLAVQIRQRGPSHPDTLAMKGNLAEYLRNERRYDEAEQLFRELMGAYLAAGGADSPELTESQAAFTVLLLFAGRLPEADRLGEEVLRRRKELPENASALGDAFTLRTRIHLARKNFGEAEAVAREAVRLRLAESPDSWRRHLAEGHLGLALAGQGRRAEAQPLLVSAHDRLVALEGSIPAVDRGQIAEILQGMVDGAQALGAPAEPRLLAELAQRRERGIHHDQVDR